MFVTFLYLAVVSSSQLSPLSAAAKNEAAGSKFCLTFSFVLLSAFVDLALNRFSMTSTECYF
jgi:hypothetical protein